MKLINRMFSLITLITLLTIFLFSGVSLAIDIPGATANAEATATGVGSQGQGQQQQIVGPLLPPAPIEQRFKGNRPFGNPGGLILPGFPTNVDTNGGSGAMYLNTATQLRFKNVWTAEELANGNSNWFGNNVKVSMIVTRILDKPSIVTLDYARNVDGKQVLPIDPKTYNYKFIGYVFARATSKNIMAPENTIDAARAMRNYGANFGIVMGDGIEKTMTASSIGISLGYTRFDMNIAEDAAGTSSAGIGWGSGKAGMKGFPYVQVAAFIRTPKQSAKIIVPKAEVIAPEKSIKPVVMKQKTSAPKIIQKKADSPMKIRTNITNYDPDLKL